jgi:hypothetical protein
MPREQQLRAPSNEFRSFRQTERSDSPFDRFWTRGDDGFGRRMPRGCREVRTGDGRGGRPLKQYLRDQDFERRAVVLPPR